VRTPGLFYSRYTVVLALAYSSVHRVTDPAIHALQHLAVGVQPLRYGSVPQRFLNVLGMDVAVEQRGAGVAKIVEPSTYFLASAEASN
jgi:hypothetical protein